MNKHVVIVEATTSGAGLEIIQSAKRNSFSVTFLTNNPKKYDNDPNRSVLGDIKVEEVEDTSNEHHLEEYLISIQQVNPIDGVLTLSDSCVEAVSKVCKKLGFRFMQPKAVEIARNKELTREKLSELDILMPKYHVVNSESDLLSFSKENKYPYILKNSKGTGSMDVQFCANENELVNAYKNLTKNMRENSKIIIEEYIIGSLISVEAITYEGKTTILGLTSRTLGKLPNFVEVAYDFPFYIGKEKEDELTHLHTRIINHMGIDFGPTHIEFLMSERGFALVEVNPRLGGGLLGRMMSDSLGYDLYLEILKMSIGMKPTLIPTSQLGATTIVIYPEKSGYLEEISTDLSNKVSGIREIFIKDRVGEFVAPPTDFKGDLGHIYAVAGTSTLSRQFGETARNHLKITINQEMSVVQV